MIHHVNNLIPVIAHELVQIFKNYMILNEVKQKDVSNISKYIHQLKEMTTFSTTKRPLPGFGTEYTENYGWDDKRASAVSW